MLETEALERLKHAWVDSGGIKASQFLPGLAQSDLESMLSFGGVDIKLNPELETLWRWCEGVMPGPNDSFSLGGGILLLPLSAATSMYRTSTRIPEYLSKAWQPEIPEQTGWFPVARTRKVTISCDCTGTTEVRMFASNEEDRSKFERIATHSLGAVIELWIEAFERGCWLFDNTTQTWSHHPAEWHELTEHQRFFVFPGLVSDRP